MAHVAKKDEKSHAFPKFPHGRVLFENKHFTPRLRLCPPGARRALRGPGVLEGREALLHELLEEVRQLLLAALRGARRGRRVHLEEHGERASDR